MQKLNALVSQAIHGELNARLKEISLIPVGDTTADYASFLAKDYASYGVIVKEAKISLD